MMHLSLVSYLNGGFVQMPQVRGGLSRLMTQDHHVGIDQSEGIDNNLQGTPIVNSRSKKLQKHKCEKKVVLLQQPHITFPLTL